MPRFDPVQSNFTSGEISPEVLGNFELERYRQALNKCENFMPKKTGGIARRGGTKFIKEVKDSADNTVLIPFNYKDEYQYILEFGDLYFRVFRNQAYVTEVVTTYDEADVKDLRFTQDEEKLYITHKDYAPAVLSRTSHTSWSLDNMEFDEPPLRLQDICWSPKLGIFVAISQQTTTDNYVKISKDGIYWETYYTGVETAWNSICWSEDLEIFCAVGTASAGPSGGVMTSPDGKTWTEQDAAEANQYRDVVWGSGAALFVAVSVDGTNRVMTSPDGSTWTTRSAASQEAWWTVCWSEDLTLFVAAANTGSTYDIMYSSNGTSWTGVLKAGTLNFIDVCWSRELALFCLISDNDPTPGSAIYTSPDGSTWTSRTAADNTVGFSGVIWSAELNLFVIIALNGTIDTQIQTSPDGVTWTNQDAPKAYGWHGLSYSPYLRKFVAIAYDIYNGLYDTAMTSLDGETWTSQYMTGISSPDWQSSNYPTICWFYEQRLFFASTPDQPNKVYGSCSLQYNVFDPGTGLDNEAIIVTLKDATKILWATTSNGILLGCRNGIFKLSSTSANEALTPTNIRPLRLNKLGSAFVDPVDVNGKTVYLQKDFRKLRTMEYELLSDRFKSTDLLILANHLTEGGISKLIYVDEPDSIIYGIRADGQLIGILYDTEYKITGGFRFIFGSGDDAVNSIAVSENPTTHEDELWLIVSRDIDGSPVQYVEILTNGLVIGDDIEDATFLDSHVVQTGSGFTTVTGLDHLEGELVYIFTDGEQWDTGTVSSGSVTCSSADKACAGLAYNSTLETLPLEGGNPIGSAMGKIKRISKMICRLFRSGYFTLSDLLGNTSEVIYPDPSDVDNLDYTGDTNELDFYGTHEQGGQIKILINNPVPFHLLAIMYQARTKD